MKHFYAAFHYVGAVRLLMCVMFLFALPVMADNLHDYEIEGAGAGSQGTYLVKVSVLSKKSKIEDNEIGRCAVHGVLFRGFANKEQRQQQKPLAGSAMVEGQNQSFFDDFFKTTYKNYYQTVSSSRQIVKVGKQYKVSCVVSVAKDQLRKDLQQAGILKGLNSGF
ncbi:MAG: hypothetical protein K2O17_06025 [Bacteroidaceae bacterium]|nr:hypothetical protein [Bacteroidaceae bacterium]